jgi:hypothetical protein
MLFGGCIVGAMILAQRSLNADRQLRAVPRPLPLQQ